MKDSLNNTTQPKWKLVLIPITILLYTMAAPSQGQSVPNTGRSVYIEGLQSFTIMANPSLGHTTNSVINLNNTYSLVSHEKDQNTHTTIWTDGKNRIIEHKGADKLTKVKIQVKKSDGTYGTIMKNKSSKRNTTIETALTNPKKWDWKEGYAVLGGSSNVNLTNMVITRATPKERDTAKGLAEKLDFKNGQWTPQKIKKKSN